MAPKALERLKRLGSPVLKGVGIALLYLLANLSPLSAANPRDVVINEVAWMGTAASSYDEWIELYNNTDEAIDLTGWKLEAADGTPSIMLFGIIPARGFFLLERTNDDTVKDIRADLIYGNDGPSWALKNEGEILYLKDPSNTIIDTANGDGGPWPAGTAAGGKPPYATMERIDPSLLTRTRTGARTTVSIGMAMMLTAILSTAPRRPGTLAPISHRSPMPGRIRPSRSGIRSSSTAPAHPTPMAIP
jgi:hypothetical protein